MPELFWHTHLYRLGTLTPPRPHPEGRAHLAGEADRELVVRWCREFCVDVGEQPSIDLIDAGAWDRSRFGDRHFTFWRTPDGTPVSMAAVTSVTGGMVRVDPVYTPSRFRGHGHAGAVTAAVSRAAREAGATDVVLFADPANPTSNALYQRLGYVRLTDCAGLPLHVRRPGVRRSETRWPPGRPGTTLPVPGWTAKPMPSRPPTGRSSTFRHGFGAATTGAER